MSKRGGSSKSKTRKEAVARKTAPYAGKRTTAYQAYMKIELPKMKRDNPQMSHREAFKMAAQSWHTSPENPKNQAGKSGGTSTEK
ncbi:hypothetical protein BCR43DRAFT_430091 [Syncephalastrum racemosum]|uniref:YABBY protein C-terminal domain-containing protein n=1 Tax=Syncephalastrum racemosum TaxID=13706 RepID=A0A1X2HVC2_SYNRA|nr:hypothetical protein BCR43DRAFT_430091 [Syncephalastrum racemosum]